MTSADAHEKRGSTAQWRCLLVGHKFKYTDHALRVHVVDFCLRCGVPHA